MTKRTQVSAIMDLATIEAVANDRIEPIVFNAAINSKGYYLLCPRGMACAAS